MKAVAFFITGVFLCTGFYVPVVVSASSGPRIQSFKATPAKVGSREASTLSWSVKDIDRCTLRSVDVDGESESQMWQASESGKYIVWPEITTMYELYCVKGTQAQSRKVTVKVIAIKDTLEPRLDRYGQLGPTAGRVGGEVAIYGKNLYPTTTVEFAGNVMGTEVHEYAGALSRTGSAIKDRIIVTVPKGAKSGKLIVCNGAVCVKTRDRFEVISPLTAEKGIEILSPHKPEAYDLDEKIKVKYRLTSWGSDLVAVYVRSYDLAGLENSKSKEKYYLVGQTKNKKGMTISLEKLRGYVIGDTPFLIFGKPVYKFEVCNVWREVCEISDAHFSIKP